MDQVISEDDFGIQTSPAEPFAREREPFPVSPAGEYKLPDSSQILSNSAAKPRKVKRPFTLHPIVKSLFLLLLVAGGVISGVYGYKTNPQFHQHLLSKADIFGTSSASKTENQRINLINKLPISYEEKQILIGKTVFIGATQEMVKLALGEPKSQTATTVNGKIQASTYLYYLADDTSPTQLQFVNNTLISAKKVSAIEHP